MQQRRRFTTLGCLAVLATALSSFTHAKPLVITLKVGDKPVKAEVADTPASRAQGLMYRRSLPTDHGMIFVFEQSEQLCFWMKNTLIPLDVAFINEQGVISNIEAMTPLLTDTHCSTQPARYALEMEQGWFEKNHKQAGDIITGLP